MTLQYFKCILFYVRRKKIRTEYLAGGYCKVIWKNDKENSRNV